MKYGQRHMRGAPMVWRNLAMTFSILFFVAIFIVGATFLSSTQEKDARTVMELAQNGAFENAKSGYYYIGWLSSILPNLVQQLIVFVLGICFIYRLFRDLRSLPMALLAALLVVSPILMFLTLFVKDTSVTLLVLLVLMILRSRLALLVRLILSLMIYIGYGAFFREYYLAIALVFALLVVILATPYPWRILYIPAIGGALYKMPPVIFSLLEGSRDIINNSRVGHNMAGARTAFLNFVPPNNVINFLIDYLYAAMRLNLAPFFNFGIKEVFLSLNILVFLALIFIGVRVRDDRIRLPTMLYLSHFLVSVLFEPDLGSYLRHSCSVMLYLVPAMAFLDRKFLSIGISAAQSRLRAMALMGIRS